MTIQEPRPPTTEGIPPLSTPPQSETQNKINTIREILKQPQTYKDLDYLKGAIKSISKEVGLKHAITPKKWRGFASATWQTFKLWAKVNWMMRKKRKDARQWTKKVQRGEVQDFCKNMDEILAHDLSADVINKRDRDGKTLLHHAVQYCPPKVLEALIAKEGVELEPKDRSGKTPENQKDYTFDKEKYDVLRGVRARRHQKTLMDELMDQVEKLEPQQINQKDELGKTFLYTAIEKYPAPVVECLLDKQVKLIEQKVIPKPDPDLFGKTLLHYAVERGDKAVLDALLSKVPDTDLNASDKQGRTPLHQAAFLRKKEMVDVLVKIVDDHGNKKVDLNKQDKQGKTPLHIVIFFGRGYDDNESKKIYDILIKNSAQLDIQDKAGKTALHYAVEKGYATAVKELIEAGAKLDIQDNAGKIPKDLAAGNKTLTKIISEALSKKILLSHRNPTV